MCGPGTGFDATSSTCVACSSSEFQTSFSLLACQSCPDPLMNGSMSCSCPVSMQSTGERCVCAAGFEFDADAVLCLPCDKGQVKEGANLGACRACEADFSTTTGEGSKSKSQCVCREGYFDANSEKDAEKQKCVEGLSGMDCEGVGTTLENSPIKVGFWREPSSNSTIRECPYESACPGSSNSSSEQCAEGYSGPLCAVCEDGYTASNVYSPCEKCFEGGEGQSVGFGLVVVLIAMYLVGGAAFYVMDKAKLKARVAKIQQFMGSMEIRVRLKLLVVYFQIVSEFELVLTSNYPGMYSSFLIVAQRSNMSLGSIFSLRCSQPGFDF